MTSLSSNCFACGEGKINVKQLTNQFRGKRPKNPLKLLTLKKKKLSTILFAMVNKENGDGNDDAYNGTRTHSLTMYQCKDQILIAIKWMACSFGQSKYFLYLDCKSATISLTYNVSRKRHKTSTVFNPILLFHKLFVVCHHKNIIKKDKYCKINKITLSKQNN